MENEQLKNQAKAWEAVFDQLYKHNPTLLKSGASGLQCALDEIKRLQELSPPTPRHWSCGCCSECHQYCLHYPQCERGKLDYPHLRK